MSDPFVQIMRNMGQRKFKNWCNTPQIIGIYSPIEYVSEIMSVVFPVLEGEFNYNGSRGGLKGIFLRILYQKQGNPLWELPFPRMSRRLRNWDAKIFISHSETMDSIGDELERIIEWSGASRLSNIKITETDVRIILLQVCGRGNEDIMDDGVGYSDDEEIGGQDEND